MNATFDLLNLPKIPPTILVERKKEFLRSKSMHQLFRDFNIQWSNNPKEDFIVELIINYLFNKQNDIFLSETIDDEMQHDEKKELLEWIVSFTNEDFGIALSGIYYEIYEKNIQTFKQLDHYYIIGKDRLKSILFLPQKTMPNKNQKSRPQNKNTIFRLEGNILTSKQIPSKITLL